MWKSLSCGINHPLPSIFPLRNRRQQVCLLTTIGPEFPKSTIGGPVLKMMQYFGNILNRVVPAGDLQF